METGKQGVAVPMHFGSMTAQREKRMEIQAPLTAVYIPAMPVKLYSQPPAAAHEQIKCQLAMPPLPSKDTLPFITLHLAGGLQPQTGLSPTASAPVAKPKSAAKHVCPHCGRDCMKPSVLEKHLRCHTGERPYPCTTCGISFKTQSNLYKHRRTQAHARLSSESENSSLGSLDSISSSRDSCTDSVAVLDHSEMLDSMEKSATVPLMLQDSVRRVEDLNLTTHKTLSNLKEDSRTWDKQRVENMAISRHAPLQRQEATLFSKQWETSTCGRKSQNLESTDSGFSECSDHYPSPSSVLPEHSIDSLTESNKEGLEERIGSNQSFERIQGESKSTSREQQQKKLEEHISKLIYENNAVVEDKKLEIVRPRKTVLSKQGSIDLPMPYTYKDSFHFDMKISPKIGLQRQSKPGLYSSMPTHCSSTIKPTPLTRSNSFPVSVTQMQPERSSSSSLAEDRTDIWKEGPGHTDLTSPVRKPVNQHSSAHRPLVRQTAVDCHFKTDRFFKASSVEDVCTSSVSCDGDGGDIYGRPNTRKIQRKKAQKFAYNKWYMYGGGTFKKLYDKHCNTDTFRGRKALNKDQQATQALVHEDKSKTSGSSTNLPSENPSATHHSANVSFGSSEDSKLQGCHLISMSSVHKGPLRRNLSLSLLPLPAPVSLLRHQTESLSATETGRLLNVPNVFHPISQLSGCHIISGTKKLKAEITPPVNMDNNPIPQTQHSTAASSSTQTQSMNRSFLHTQSPAHGAPCSPNTVSTNVQTSKPVITKNSFLPKYQLQLPSTESNEEKHLPQIVGRPKQSDIYTMAPVLLTTTTDQTPSCDNTCGNSVPSSFIPMFVTSMTNAASSLQHQHITSGSITSLCNTETTKHKNSLATSQSFVLKQFAETSITTSCLQGRNRSYRALAHSLQTAANSVLPHIPKPHSMGESNLPFPTTINKTSNAISTALPQYRCPLSSWSALEDNKLSTMSNLSSDVNNAHAGSHSSNVTHPINPPDQQAQNVFHVQTADLQICLQIISDEQLALIEPHIECPSDSSLSQTISCTDMRPRNGRDESQSFHATEISDDGGENVESENQKEAESREALLKSGTGGTSPQTLREGLAIHQPAVSKHFQHLDKYNHRSTVTNTLSCIGSCVSTAGSPGNADCGISQSGVVSETLPNQNKLNESSLSINATNQTRVRMSKESEHECRTHSCNVNALLPSGEAVTGKYVEKSKDLIQLSRLRYISQHHEGESAEHASQNLQCTGTEVKKPEDVSMDNSNIQRLIKEFPEEAPIEENTSIEAQCVCGDGTKKMSKKNQEESKDEAHSVSDQDCDQVMAENIRGCLPGSHSRSVASQSMTQLEEQQPLSKVPSGMESHSSYNPNTSSVLFSESGLSSVPPKANPCPPHNNSSMSHNTQLQVFGQSACSLHITAQVHSSESGIKASSYQDQKHTPSLPQQVTTTASHCSSALSVSVVSESHTPPGFLPAFRTSSDFHHIPHVSMSTAQIGGGIQTSDNNLIPGSSWKTLPEPGAKSHDTGDATLSHYSLQSCSMLEQPNSNKHQFVFIDGPLHGFQPAGYLSGEARLAPVCPEHTEDSSSDDEGKLIIEL